MNIERSCAKFEPLRAVVIGAAAGIGAQFAQALAGHGAKLALVDIDKVPLARLANTTNAHAFACDILSETSVNQMVEHCVAALGGADLLINAAGKGYVRALGMMRVSRAFAVAGGGKPIIVVNVAAATTNLEQFGYGGSKQAFRRLSEGLGNAFAARGVEVITLDEQADEGAVEELVAGLGQRSEVPAKRSARR